MAKSIERYAKKGLKRLHTATKVLMVLTLAVGILIGAAACLVLSREDRFQLRGETHFALDVAEEGSVYHYVEDGVEAVCFGRDVGDKLHVETALEKDADGRYVIPTDREGVYTITYTVDCLKFGENAPNGVIKRIRVFTVTAAEEDGRNG
ncbi:MAG: hypothetical protein IJW51_02725 [Clostridia bacterium]|nr:hypothetical protein [Clostridia bacterium]